VVIVTETVENNLRFPGQYFDQESGLHYNYYRDYDPSVGRYITSDPIGLIGGMNPFLYVYANPLKFADSIGLIPPWIFELAYEVGCYAAERTLDRYAQEWRNRAENAYNERDKAREGELQSDRIKCDSIKCMSLRQKCIDDAYSKNLDAVISNLDQLETEEASNPYTFPIFCPDVRFPIDRLR